MSSVTVSSKYQIVIPKDVRERFGFQPGDKVSWFDPGDGSVRIVKVLSFDEMGGILSGFDTEPFVREKDHDGGEST